MNLALMYPLSFIEGLIQEHIQVLSSITSTVKKMESEKYYLQPIVSQQKD